MSEFALIEKVIHQFGELTQADFIATGPGDDAAVFTVPDGEELVVSTDTMVPDVHFPREARADLVGFRAVAINASDLAAMGARPLCMTIALSMPSIDQDWTQNFVHGVIVAASEFDLKIVGGNLARGPLNITLTVHGSVPKGNALLRSTAKVGDDVWVTGLLGATNVFLKSPSNPEAGIEELLAQRDGNPCVRYFLPHPRLAFAQQLRGIAHAAIDLSDGFMSELQHLTTASQCGARIDLNRLPVWSDLTPKEAVGSDDSYELLFTASPTERPHILNAASDTNTSVVILGEITAEKTLELTLDGETLDPVRGFDHFV